MSNLRAILAITLSFAASAEAQQPRTPEPFLGGIVQERDIDLVFGFLRESVRAAMEGRDVAPSPELTSRAGAIAEDLKRRGAAAANAVLDAIEQSVREGVREPARREPLPPGRMRI